MDWVTRSRFRQVGREVDALDVAVFEAVAHTKSPAMDAVMPRLTDLADHSKLWMGVAGLLAVSGNRRAKRGALRGMVTLGVTSLVANQVAKRVHRRPRPSVASIPLTRLSRRIPTSTSFPSGHSASAAAFATAVGMEAPTIGIPLKALAGLVGLSRVATGAHYPSDVAGGFLLGAAIAAVGGKLVPPVPPPSQLLRPYAVPQVTPRPRGEGVTLVVNPGSNSGRGEKVLKELRKQLPDLEVVELTEDSDVEQVMDRAAKEAEVIGVAGGDGTVGAAAKAALAHGIPLAVFPAGTFNHFAKDVRTVPIGKAVDAVRAGTVTKVDVAYLNDELFLNTASVGAYTHFVAIRERYEGKVGKPLAALYAGLRTIRRRQSMRVRVDDVTSRVNLLFLGNGQYQPRGFAPSIREQMDDGLLDLRMLDASHVVSRLKVLVAILTGQLARNKRYHEISAPSLDIELLDGPVRVARDGELGETTDRLRVHVDRRALTVYQPADAKP